MGGNGLVREWLVAKIIPEDQLKLPKIVSIRRDPKNIVREIKLQEGDQEIDITDDSITGTKGVYRETFWQLYFEDNHLKFNFQQNGHIKNSFASLTVEEKRAAKAAGFNPGLVSVMHTLKNIDNPFQRKNIFKALIWGMGTYISELLYIAAANPNEPLTLTNVIKSGVEMLPSFAMATNSILALLGKMDEMSDEMILALQSHDLKFMLNAVAHYMTKLPRYASDALKITEESLKRKVNMDAIDVGPLAFIPVVIDQLTTK